jgi:hypothetical protein
MARQPVRDASGRTRGWIDDTATHRTAYNQSGQTLGRYDKKADKTYDKSGHLISSAGDVLTSLFDLFSGKKK